MHLSVELIRALVAAAPDALVGARSSGEIVWVNEEAEKLFGWCQQEVVDQSLDVLVPGWAPTVPAPSGGDSVWARRRDGSTFRAEISGKEFEAPEGRFLTVTVRDVTVARRTERRLRAVLESAPDAILGVDAAGRIELLNAQAERLFGWTAEELRGQQVEVLVPESIAGPHTLHRATYGQAPSHRPMGAGLQLSARRKDGTTFPAEISLSAVSEEPGLLVLAAIRDVSDRMEMEADRRRQDLDAQRERSHRLESLGELAGGIAHDFNNLLGVILNFTTLISRRVDDPTVTADLGEIRSAAERGAGLTRQLLAFARRDIANPLPVEVNEVIRDAASMLQRTLGEHVELRLDLAPGPMVALADPNQLEQIVLNLAINSRDAMPDGGRLTIVTQRSPAATQLAGAGGAQLPDVVLRVVDTGHGMAPEVVKRAFEPFFTTKERGRGTGLGLATVYGIVRQNGGDVTIESRVGEGTAVTVTLRGAQGSLRGPAGAHSPLAGGRERILLVEDEATLRAGTARLLADHGYEVIVANDGLEALEVFDREVGAIDLVLSDVAMPRMRGDDLARALAERAAPVRVVLMTGYDTGDLGNIARPLSKPVAEEELLRVIREVLDG
jgi:PAS domain S-box-containing protein